MSLRTNPVTFRILREHEAAIKSKLPEGETGSSLVRNLLTLYFNGIIPKYWVFKPKPQKKTA